DLVYGFRMLLKKPGFTFVAALSLALGIGANTVIFSLINTTLLRPLPYPEPDRLVMIWSAPLDHPDQLNGVAAYNYLAFQERAKSFESMGLIRDQICNIGADEHGQPPERVDCENFAPSMFRTLGVKPILGRVLADDENPIDTPANGFLISYRFWQQRFNGDRNVIGKKLRVDELDKTIIGVMPPNFYLFDAQADFWTPLNWTRTEMASTQYTSAVAARLKPGVTLKQAQAEMDQLAVQQAASDPGRAATALV